MNSQLQKKLMAAFPDSVYIASHTSTDWSSVQFDGQRHQICLGVEFDTSVACAIVSQIKNETLDLGIDGYVVGHPTITEVAPIHDTTFITVEVVTLND